MTVGRERGCGPVSLLFSHESPDLRTQTTGKAHLIDWRAMVKIYLSSTYSDLKQHREALYHALRELRYDVVAMEDYIATDKRPLDKCLRDVAESDIYVGIFAWRYGYIPVENNPDRRSITELEYRHAVRLGIPQLIFVLDEKTPWSPVDMDSKTDDEDRGRRIDSLRKELALDRTVSFFSSIDELARKAVAAIQLKLGEHEPQAQASINPEIPQQRFVDHMRRFAGAASHYQALARYADASVQEVKYTHDMLSKLPTGSWTDLVEYPDVILLASEAGSGKTTLLLHEASRLAVQISLNSDAQIPVYFSMAGFRSGDAQTLLEMAADANAMKYGALEAAWSDGTPRICMMIDDADKYTANQASISAICQLLKRKASTQSLTVACQPGAWRDELESRTEAFREVLILPLSEAAVADFLKRFARDELGPVSDGWIHEDTRIGEMLRRPDVLSAWLQSPDSGTGEQFHPSVGIIFKLYLAHIFNRDNPKYDYERIKVPVLAKLAYDLASHQKSSIMLDDTLYGEIVPLLQDLHDKYHRLRRVMPNDWTAEDLLREIALSPVMEPVSGNLRELRFSRRRFQDFFIAMEIQLSRNNSQKSANHLSKVGIMDSADALVMALGLDPAAHDLIDEVSAVQPDLAQQVWAEGRPAGMPAPSFIQREFDRRRKSIWEQFDTARLRASSRQMPVAESLRRPQSCSDLNAIRAWKKLPRLPVEMLLEIAADSHPLVQGVIDYMLLHSGEDSLEPSKLMQLPLAFDQNHRFSFSSRGGGEVRIGDMTLLKVPTASDVSLNLSIDRISFDPFQVNSELRFLPTPAVSIAARIFRGLGMADWLGLGALCHCFSSHAAATAERAGQYTELQDLRDRLITLAGDFSAMGQVIADDLGLSWPHIMVGDFEGDLGLAYEQYCRLRRTFGMANESRLRAVERAAGATSRPEGTPQAGVDLTIQRVLEGGTVLGIKAGEISIVSDSGIEYYDSRLARLTANQTVREVIGGTVEGIAIETLAGASEYLPIRMALECNLSVEEVSTGLVGGISIQHLTGKYPNWEVECNITVRKLTGMLEGVVIQNHDAELATRAVHMWSGRQ